MTSVACTVAEADHGSPPRSTDFGGGSGAASPRRSRSAAVPVSSGRSRRVTVSSVLPNSIGRDRPVPASSRNPSASVSRSPRYAIRRKLSGSIIIVCSASGDGGRRHHDRSQPVAVRVDLVDRLAEGAEVSRRSLAAHPRRRSRSRPGTPGCARPTEAAWPANDTSAAATATTATIRVRPADGRPAVLPSARPRRPSAQRPPADEPRDRQEQVGERQPDRERQQGRRREPAADLGRHRSTRRRVRREASTMIARSTMPSVLPAPVRCDSAAATSEIGCRTTPRTCSATTREPDHDGQAARPAPSTAARCGAPVQPGGPDDQQEPEADRCAGERSASTGTLSSTDNDRPVRRAVDPRRRATAISGRR